MQKHGIAILIPAFNEEKTILKVCEEAQHFGQVIVIDDNSSDKTNILLKANKYNYIKNDFNVGYEKSLINGIKYVLENQKNIKYLISLDADNELPPKNISTLLNLLEKEHIDIIVGQRNRLNRFTESILNVLFKFKFGINDPVSGFKVYKREVLENIIPNVSKNLFLVDILTMAFKKGYLVKNCKIHVNKRSDSSRVGSYYKINLKIIKIITHVLSA